MTEDTIKNLIKLTRDVDDAGNLSDAGQVVAHIGTTKTFTVTVASKTSAHRYNGSGSGNGYVINGVEAPYIELLPDVTYQFDQSDSSNSGHPLRFYLEADKTTQYSTGVTTNGTPGSAGAYTQIAVTDATPVVLYYQCSAHAFMGNAVSVENKYIINTFASNNYAASTFAGNTYAASTFTSNAFFQDNKSSGPTITSIHPSANLFPGDTVYIDGTGFDRSANVIIVSNTNIDFVIPRGSLSFNNSANLTFTLPTGTIFLDEDYDVRVTVDNTGLAAVELDALDLLNSTGFQGRYSGYATSQSRIDKFPFASDGNATDVGDLSVTRYAGAGQSSKVSGYSSGSNGGNVIDKFPFAADGNATDVGDLTVSRYRAGGQSSTTSGYMSGGQSPVAENVIDKFPFASDGNATDVGDLTVARFYIAGQSSGVSGYSSSGYAPPSVLNTIDKFPFSSDANATDVGDLTVARYGPSGQSSDVSGYSSGGTNSGFSTTNTIDKFPFASDANATDVGDLVTTVSESSGQSSTVSGYASGGTPGQRNRIEKFPFASDSNSTDIANLSTAVNNAVGQQI